MKRIVFIGLIWVLFAACNDHDTYTWNNRTVAPPDQMADTNQYIDVKQWKPEDRTANPAHYQKQKQRVQEHLKSGPVNK